MGLVDELPGMAYRRRNDRTWTMEFVSAGSEDLTGHAPEQLIGNAEVAYGDLIHPEDRDRVWEQVQAAIDNDEKFQLEYRIRPRDDQEKWVLEQGLGVRSRSGELLTLEGFILDVSDRKQLEERLHQVERLESIGRLAGGIAHDFNNILTAIEGFAELTADTLGPDHECADDVHEIKKAAQRATSLTKQLLAFSRQQVLQPQVIEINQVVYDTERLLQRVLGDDIEVEADLDASAGNIEVDPGQLEQVLVNLAVNARDAMPDGGELTIETAPMEIDAEYAETHPGIEPGSFALLSVSDTGCGIPPEIRDKIFEPFFTTREEDQGSGLGLSTVYGIVKQSGGFIWVYSEVDEGTTFKLYFPRTEEEPTEPHSPSEVSPEEAGATILLVEDTVDVRQIAVRSLTDAGHTVLEAASSEEALEILDEHPDPIDLLVTDVMLLGEGSGQDLARKAADRLPALEVLFISGYTEKAALRRKAFPPGVDFLPKPFSPSALRAKVREILGG